MPQHPVFYLFRYTLTFPSLLLGGQKEPGETCRGVIICFFVFFQLAKVKGKVKDVPALLASFDKLYGKLHINGQVTTHTLDALLCHTPKHLKPHTVLINKRTVSRRTFQPLSQSLWAE